MNVPDEILAQKSQIHPAAYRGGGILGSYVKQPRGGYLPPSWFQTIPFSNENGLFPTENIHPSLVGLVVHYLTRYMQTGNIRKAFHVPMVGAQAKQMLSISSRGISPVLELAGYLTKINGLSEFSIVNACKAVTFDV